MSISSLQSLILKYGANYGIKTGSNAAATDPKTDSDSGSTSASSSGATGKTAKPAAAAAKTLLPIAAKDTVNLSPAAKEFLSAHTGPLGKFEMPNMMNYFFDSGNGSDETEGQGTSLADFLGNPGKSASEKNPLSSLSGFL